MNAILCVSASLFVLYVLIVSLLNGKLLPSVSDGYYVLLSKKLSPIFFLSMCTIGITVMIYVLDKFPNYQFLIFLAGSGLCFVGVASEFKESFVKTVHVYAALICGVCATLWTLFYGNILLTSLFAIVFLGLYLYKRMTLIMAFELFAFINMYITLFNLL